MPDSNAAQQDDAAGKEPDATARVNGLMSALGRKEAENQRLRDQLADINAKLAEAGQEDETDSPEPPPTPRRGRLEDRYRGSPEDKAPVLDNSVWSH